ncbi:MFS transporter [Paraburkholderia fungorum]|uniref:MFS transporter n=1 Tax=Paraburkholderia fungorum TaxID=134537 RepID=UPI0038BA8B69
MNSRVRWMLISLLFFGGAISYLDRAALSVAAPFIVRELNLDPASLGLVFSSFFIGYTVFCFVGGYSADRFGPKTVFTWAMTGWSVFCGLTAICYSLTSLIIVRVIFGAGEGPFCSTANKLVANWFPRHEQASAVGIANAGQPLGAALAGPLVGYLALTFGWRVSFVAIASVGIVWVLIWMIVAKDSPYGSQKELDRRAPSREKGASLAELGSFMARPMTLATAFAFFGYFYVLYFFLSWFPSYLTMSQHLTVQRMALFNVVPWIGGFLGLASGGFICDTIFKLTGRAIFARKLIITCSLACAAVCTAFAGAVTNLYGAVALMTFAVFSMYVSGSSYFAIVFDTVPGERVGAVSGFVHLVGNLAGVLAPAITGFLVKWSGNFENAFYVTAGVAAFGCLAVVVFVNANQPGVLTAAAQSPIH